MPTACDPNAPWGTPVLIPELSTADGQEAALTLSADERTIYLQRDVASVPTILTGTRADRHAPFGALAPALDIEGEASFEQQPALTRDGLAIYFARSPRQDIVRATRASTDRPFSNITPFVATAITEAFPQPGSKDLWYVTRKPAGGFDGLYVRPLAATDSADPAASTYVAFPKSDGADDFFDITPVLDENELTLYFSTTRENPAVFAIYVAKRASRDDAFSSPVRADALSSGKRDFPAWLSPDGCRMYLTSNRDGSTLDVYLATRTP